MINDRIKEIKLLSKTVYDVPNKLFDKKDGSIFFFMKYNSPHIHCMFYKMFDVPHNKDLIITV